VTALPVSALTATRVRNTPPSSRGSIIYFRDFPFMGERG
jgi:hypothetical protein